MSNELKVGDLLGAKPLAEAVNTVAKATTEGAGAFLSRICLPAAEEFGLLLRDQVHAWRKSNLERLAALAEEKHRRQPNSEETACPPRIACNILEEGSWVDDIVVQDLWAGLLSSSCTEDGDDESNLIFIKKLTGMTRLQVTILKFACEQVPKTVDEKGLLAPAIRLSVPLSALMEFTGEADIQRLDRELDDLRESGMLQPDSGFTIGSETIAYINPSPLALHMYVRCQGSRKSPAEFFEVSVSNAVPAVGPSDPPPVEPNSEPAQMSPD